MINWREIVKLEKRMLEGWDEPDAHFYEVVRLKDDRVLAYLDLAPSDNQWIANMLDSEDRVSYMLSSDDVLAIGQAMSHLNSWIRLMEMVKESERIGLYD